MFEYVILQCNGAADHLWMPTPISASCGQAAARWLAVECISLLYATLHARRDAAANQFSPDARAYERRLRRLNDGEKPASQLRDAYRGQPRQRHSPAA